MKKLRNGKIMQWTRAAENVTRRLLWHLPWRRTAYKELRDRRDIVLLRPDLLHLGIEAWERIDAMQRKLGEQSLRRYSAETRLENARNARMRLLTIVKSREFCAAMAQQSAQFGYGQKTSL